MRAFPVNQQYSAFVLQNALVLKQLLQRIRYVHCFRWAMSVFLALVAILVLYRENFTLAAIIIGAGVVVFFVTKLLMKLWDDEVIVVWNRLNNSRTCMNCHYIVKGNNRQKEGQGMVLFMEICIPAATLPLQLFCKFHYYAQEGSIDDLQTFEVPLSAIMTEGSSSFSFMNGFQTIQLQTACFFIELVEQFS